MASKKYWKNKTRNKKERNKPQKLSREQSLGKQQDGRISARLAIEDMTCGRLPASHSPDGADDLEGRGLGQASTRSSQHQRLWHDPFDSYLYPPTSLNFRPPFDTDASHLARRSPGLTEYEGQSVEIWAPTMAPGNDQQQRNQPLPPYRPNSQQNSNQQRPNANPNDIPINEEQQPRNQVARDRDTERDQTPRKGPDVVGVNRPMQSHIQVAKPYVFQQAIEICLKDVGVAQAREDNIRLAGVQWIDNVRRALKLPVRTFDTAVVYYHKFRLVHSDGEYSFVDAAAAALFAACKIEDTLKKSRDILCAAHNLKVPRSEHLSPDDTTFEHHSRSIIGLERLMLEASSFDFRNRHPQTLMLKLAKHYDIGPPKTSTITKTAYAISLDLYRTFAPLKQSTSTLAFSCLELAIRLHNETTSSNPGINAIIHGTEYSRWGITRAEVMETLLDLLELYTHYRTSTTAGPDLPLDVFLEVRIPLNDELNSARLPRFTEYIDTGRANNISHPAGPVNGISPTTATSSTNGTKKTDKSPTSPTAGAGAKVNGLRQKAGERGREGTVRFMLNPDRERQERLVVADYLPPQTPQQGPPSQPAAQGQGQGERTTPSYGAPNTGSLHGPGFGSGPGPGHGHGHGRGGRGGHGHGPNNRPYSSGRGDGPPRR